MGDILTTIGVSFATALAVKGAEGPAQTVDDLWFLAFGQWIHPIAEARRSIVLEKQQAKVNAFKQKSIED